MASSAPVLGPGWNQCANWKDAVLLTAATRHSHGFRRLQFAAPAMAYGQSSMRATVMKLPCSGPGTAALLVPVRESSPEGMKTVKRKGYKAPKILVAAIVLGTAIGVWAIASVRVTPTVVAFSSDGTAAAVDPVATASQPIQATSTPEPIEHELRPEDIRTIVSELPESAPSAAEIASGPRPYDSQASLVAWLSARHLPSDFYLLDGIPNMAIFERRNGGRVSVQFQAASLEDVASILVAEPSAEIFNEGVGVVGLSLDLVAGHQVFVQSQGQMVSVTVTGRRSDGEFGTEANHAVIEPGGVRDVALGVLRETLSR